VALATNVLPYGLRDVKLRGFTDPGTATAPDASSTDLPYARTMSFSESEDFEELRGDATLVTVRGKGPAVDWELESGGISFESYQKLNGGTVSTLGTTGVDLRKRYRKSTTDSKPFFKAEGQAISDSGGDFHGLLYRCRVTGDLGGELGDGVFWLTACSGTALGSYEASVLNALYDLIQYEVVTPISSMVG
jgi:hypothetical protein